MPDRDGPPPAPEGLRCAAHPDRPAVAGCVDCDVLLCRECRTPGPDGLTRCAACLERDEASAPVAGSDGFDAAGAGSGRGEGRTTARDAPDGRHEGGPASGRSEERAASWDAPDGLHEGGPVSGRGEERTTTSGAPDGLHDGGPGSSRDEERTTSGEAPGPGWGARAPGPEASGRPSSAAPDARAAFAGPDAPADAEILPWEHAGRYGPVEGLWRTFTGAAQDPARFVSRIPWVRRDLLTPLAFAVLCAIAGNVTTVLIALLAPADVGELFLPPAIGEGPGPSPLEMLIGLPLVPLVVTAGLFAASALSHGVLRLFGLARRPFEATFRAYAYAQVAAVLMLVPVAGHLLATIGRFALLIMGLRAAHGLTPGQALLGLLPLLLLLLAAPGLGLT